MAEPTKEQFGDGQDNLGQAASKAAEAARLFSEQAASKGAEMAVNSAAASVQAGLEGGSTVANIAAGTAAGGPWGAVISAAWAMRHTLYKILICICLFFTVIIVLVVALPSIVTESVFGLNGTQPDPNATLESSYTQMADAVSAAVEAGYDQSLAKVEQIIADGGYDYNLSMDAMINHAQSTAGYDVAYILAAYSASLQQKGTNVDDMVQKLQDVGDLMFPVTYVEKEQENLIPVSYCTYKPQTVTVVTAIQPAGVVNGVAKYNYTTEQRTYYIPDETLESDVELTIDSYRAITVTVPIYSGSKIAGVEQKTFYKENGTETISPTIEIIKYVECTMNDLFTWMQNAKAAVHPLILSSVFHYEFVFIHPFSDGNGRMARLWHTAILSKWKSIFEYIPIESQIEKFQEEYYKAIAQCHVDGESTAFIAFMLSQIDKILDDISVQISEDSDLLSEYVKKLLEIMEYDIPYTSASLMEKLGLKSREGFRRNYLHPALEMNLIRMTIPDKPNSRNQRYIKL